MFSEKWCEGRIKDSARGERTIAMMTYREWLLRAEECFSRCGIEEARADAWLILAYGAGIDRLWYSLHGGEAIPEECLGKLGELEEKRCRRIPVQQIVGEAWFMGQPFYVNEHVLIPRQDTEVLAEHALGLLAEKTEKKGGSVRLLDLCTGSGCILLGLVKAFPGFLGVGADISPKALAVARKNAARLGVEVSFILSDLWEQIEGTFDMIVSNPPYIARAVIAELAPEVREHEPFLALDGGEDGLSFYRRIVGRALDYLEEGGNLSLEIGYDQGAAVAALMEEEGFVGVRVIRDLSGLDRVVTGNRGIDCGAHR